MLKVKLIEWIDYKPISIVYIFCSYASFLIMGITNFSWIYIFFNITSIITFLFSLSLIFKKILIYLKKRKNENENKYDKIKNYDGIKIILIITGAYLGQEIWALLFGLENTFRIYFIITLFLILFLLFFKFIIKDKWKYSIRLISALYGFFIYVFFFSIVFLLYFNFINIYGLN